MDLRARAWPRGFPMAPRTPSPIGTAWNTAARLQPRGSDPLRADTQQDPLPGAPLEPLCPDLKQVTSLFLDLFWKNKTKHCLNFKFSVSSELQVHVPSGAPACSAERLPVLGQQLLPPWRAAVVGGPSAEGKVPRRTWGSSQAHSRPGPKEGPEGRPATPGPSDQQGLPEGRAPVHQRTAQEQLSVPQAPRAVRTQPRAASDQGLPLASSANLRASQASSLPLGCLPLKASLVHWGPLLAPSGLRASVSRTALLRGLAPLCSPEHHPQLGCLLESALTS